MFGKDEGPVEVNGYISEDKVIIKSEQDANRLYNKRRIGIPLAGGGLSLNLIETLYLMGKGQLRVFHEEEREINAPELFSLLGGGKGEYVSFFVYSDILERGYHVSLNSPEGGFRVWKKGKDPLRTPSDYWIAPRSELSTITIPTALEMWKKGKALKKETIFGVVDEEGDVNYYTLHPKEPSGEARPSQQKEKREHAQKLGTFSASPWSTFTLRPAEDGFLGELTNESIRLWKEDFFGKPIPPFLILSAVEGMFLATQGRAVLTSEEKTLSLERVWNTLKEKEKNFPLRYFVYSDLRRRGLRVKTGYKYGCDFRAYETHQDLGHAPYLVWCVEKNREFGWPEISRAQRLAHGVRKNMLFAYPENDLAAASLEEGVTKKVEVGYVIVKRIRL